ncbi:MAG TPA: DUF6176 family protein [Anaerolineales bacterium]|nr:DUF6176 family protein [Anaerolineales bacterium]
MLKVSIQMVKPGQEGKLRDWLSELVRRQDEVRETFKQETVRHEQGYLLKINDGTALLYIVEAEDLEQASKAYKDSTLPIDAEHRNVMHEVLGDRIPTELLYDVSL